MTKEHDDDDVLRVISNLDQIRLGPAGSGTGICVTTDMLTFMVAAGDDKESRWTGYPFVYITMLSRLNKEEMMDRTDRLMAGVKRMLDEMRVCLLNNLLHHLPQSLQQQSSCAAGSPKSMQQLQQPSTALSLKLQPIEERTANRGDGSGGEQERNVIWLVVDATSVHD